MNSLQPSVDEYLSLRRHLGFTLEQAGYLLPDFAAYMAEAGTSTVTIDLALAWAKQPADGSAGWWQARLSIARNYVRYLHGIDPSHEIPPDGLLPRGRQRVEPHIYTEAAIFGLMSAAGALGTDLRAATYTTLIGLLVTTGMRSGEAIRLDRSDIDWDEGVLFIRLTKFGKSRELVLAPTTVDALRRYDGVRRRCCPRPQTPAFFVSAIGARLRRNALNKTFHELIRRTGLEPKSGVRWPRPHDLRHTFAVNTLVDWYRSGLEINSKMYLLSTYLGHTNPTHTYWYLSSTLSLLTLATNRLEAAQADVS
jgi:integrase